MPSNEEHQEHTFQRYGIRAEDIHRWMDEPWVLYGQQHRWTRHDLKIIPKVFIDKYGEELTKQIMIDHILLDQKQGMLPERTDVELSNKIMIDNILVDQKQEMLPENTDIKMSNNLSNLFQLFQLLIVTVIICVLYYLLFRSSGLTRLFLISIGI